MPDATSGSGPDGRGLEAHIEEALAAHADGGEEALTRWLDAHPSHADAVREHVARLAAFGLLDAAGDGCPARAPSDRLGGFRLVERIGEGGMGLVWIAEEEALGRRVALKMIRPEQLWFAGARERFRREVEAVARLQHPGIVPVYAAGEEGGVPFFTMELVDGCTLADVLRELRGRDPARLAGADLARVLDGAARPGDGGKARDAARGALFEGSWTDACLRIAQQVAEALDHAHGRGLVHRDVKPSNVALTRFGRALLLDFGLVRSDTADRMTRTASQPGSLPYMSPEQLAGEEIDARSDVYSLGATLYELLTLRPAFEGASATEVARRIAQGELERPRARVPGLPRDVETVCLEALAVDRSARYADAAALARDLGNLLARRPIEARRPGPWMRLVRWAQRRPRASAAVAVALPLFLVATLAVAWVERARSAEILRLADVRRLADLEQEADALWPALPERVPDYDGWIHRADTLLERLPLHRATLARLEARGADEGDDARRWQRDTLAGLIGGLERLSAEDGLAADVRARLELARTIEERSVTGLEARAAWDGARASISDPAACPAYGGLALDPQLGLLPVGRDPDSGLWEFAHLASGAPPERDDAGGLVLAPDSAVVLVLLPGGTFRMGSVMDPADPERDPLAEEEETPLHEVELAPFFMAKHPLTRSQWRRLAAEGDADDGRSEPLYPMTDVTWLDCERVLSRAALVLPTEAQWEYAARGGTRTPWWTGAEKASLEGAANLLDASLRRAGRASPGLAIEDWLDDGFTETSPVDALRANPFGLHDVAGNVVEWCRDRYALYDRPVRAGDGLRLEATTENRVQRGGACVGLAPLARSAWRAAQPPGSSSWALGVRASRPLDGAAPSD